MAEAQVYFGAELTPDAFSKKEDINLEKPHIEPFALGLSNYFSSSTLCEVFESTEPEKQVTGYMGQGFYKQEIIKLILISEKSKVPFKKLAKERDKGKTFEDFAKKHSIDLYELLEKSTSIKEKIEAELSAPVAPFAPAVRPADVNISTTTQSPLLMPYGAMVSPILETGSTVYDSPEVELSSSTSND
jgi:hypothetical protein